MSAMQNAIVLVDEKGILLGDWRNFDVEGIRQVIMLLNNCLSWFENHLHVKLIAFFAKKKPFFKRHCLLLSSRLFDKLAIASPPKNLLKSKENVQDYLAKCLGVQKGLESTFEEFAKGMKDSWSL